MHQFPRALSVAALSVALLAGPLAASPAVAEQERPTPTASQATPTASEEAAERTVLTVEHTDALAMALADGRLDLFTYADLPGAPAPALTPPRQSSTCKTVLTPGSACPQGSTSWVPKGQPSG